MSTQPDRKRRLGLLGGALAVALVVVVIAIVISQGDGDEESARPAGGGTPQTGETERVRRGLEGIPQQGVTLGEADAPATLIEFADLQCPFCAQYATQALPTVLDRYVRSGRLKLQLRLLAFLGPDS